MKVVLFIDTLHVGGTQRQMLVIAKGLAGLGVDVELLAIYPGGRFWNEASVWATVPLRSLYRSRPKQKLRRISGFFSASVRLRRYLLESRPDVIYSLLNVANLTARLAMFGFPGRLLLVWGIRASARQAGARARIVAALCRLLSGQVPLVIGNSARGIEAHRGMGFRIHSSAVVHNGFDTRQFHFDANGRAAIRDKWQVTPDKVLVGLVGRVDPMKGHDVFLQSAALLKDEQPALRFVCIGPGSDEAKAQLADRVRLLQLEDRVLIVDGESDMNAAYSALDLVVSASIAEGFPNVIGEAMACERACVVTDVGDTAALVGDVGHLVPAGDERALASAVVRALDGREETGKLGRVRIIEKFSMPVMAAKTRDALAGALAS